MTSASNRHVIQPGPGTTTDVFSRDLPPVLTIEPGDTVVVGSLDASGYLSRQQAPGEDRPRMFAAARGHCLTGPIAVAGAMPGMVLSLRFVSLRPGEWGSTAAGARDNRLTRRLRLAPGSPSWLLWEIDADRGMAGCHRGYAGRVPPFLRGIGMPPPHPRGHS